MSSTKMKNLIATLGTAATLAGFPAFVHAQGQEGWHQLARRTIAADSTDNSDAGDVRLPYTFKSRADSISWARNRAVAERATGFHLVVSLKDRHLWAVIGGDTVLSAPVAVAKGTTLNFEGREWTFNTPRGVRTVLDKSADPIWQPPEWLYAETAQENGLKLGHLNHPIKLEDGRTLTVRDGYAGLIEDGEFDRLPTDEHIVFDNTLFVPPMGTENRKIHGELGKYRLDMGDGFLLHGTPYQESIGMAATHGCVRMRDEDIEWLYDHVPVGTKVYIY